MSAQPIPPLYEQEPPKQPPRRPHRRWLRIVGWIAGGLGILILLIVVAVVVLLHSSRFHDYVLRTAQQKASTALGTKLSARDFKLSWSGISPSLDLYNVVVAGAPPYPDPPLLAVDHIHVGVTVTSLLRRTWYFNDATVDHPVVRVFVDKSGKSNIPEFGKSNSSSSSKTDIFDLGVRHALLDRGEVYFNNRKSLLDADLHELTFRAAFDTSQQKYTGSMSYRDGHLKMQGYEPIPHDLDASFAAGRTVFTLDNATLSSGQSKFVWKAEVDDYNNPKVKATYDATLNTGEFRRILRNPSLPVGVITAKGDLNYVSEPNRPALDTVTLNGTLGSNALNVQTSSLRTQIRDIGAKYSIANGDLNVNNIRAKLLGGELTGTLIMRHLTGNTRSELNAALKGVNVATLKPMMNTASLQRVALTGGLNATAHAAWGKTMNDLQARTDATLNARMAPANGGNAIPLDGVIHANYSAPAKQVTLNQSYLRTPQTSINLNGTVSDRSALAIQMRSNDLHELETMKDVFQPPQQGQQPLDLYGTATFNGNVTGTTANPRVTGQLNAANLKVRGSSWKVLRTNLDVSPSNAALQNGTLQPADRGNINFNLRAGLSHWSFTKTSPIDVGLNASNINVQDLTKLAGSSAPVSGTLAANLTVSGTELNPAGHGSLNVTQAKVAAEPVNALNVNFNGTGQQVNATMKASLPAGAANAVLTYFPQDQGYQAQLHADGIRLDQLQTVKDKNMGVKGVLNMDASGKGTLKDPQLTASITIPSLAVKDQKISNLKLDAAVANHVANYTLASALMQTNIQSKGTVQLTGDYYANATLDTQAIPLGPLVALYAPTQAGNISGQTELHATLRGPLKRKELVEAHLTIPTLNVAYKNTVQIGAASPIHADYANGVLNLQRAAIRGTDTNLQFQGSVPVVNRNAPMSLLLQGTVNLQLAELFNPDLETAGQLQFDINSYGQRTNPDVQGQVRIVNATFATGDVPLGMQNGNGVLTLTKDRLDITQFQATVGGGTMTATGGVQYRPDIRFNILTNGKDVRLLYPGGIRAGFDDNLALVGSMDTAILRGAVDITNLSFTPEFDLMSFMGSLGGGAATPPPAQGFASNLQLNLALQSPSGINLVSREMSIAGNTNLHITGTAAQPVILGRVNITSGDLIFNGNRYLLQNGTLDFVNPTQTLPVVNMAVNTTIDQYNIQMRFWGPADHLHTNYASDPALPPSDVINLVAFGKTTEAAAANPTPPGNLGAESMIASQVSSQVTSRIAKVAGISQLSIDPVLGSGGQTPGARIAVQQRVTSKMFVTFSTDVTNSQNEAIKLEYQASPRVSYNVVRDQNGGFAVTTRIKKKW